MDFLQDSLANKRKLKLKVFSIVDECSRKCYNIEVDTSITGTRVCEVLDKIAEKQHVLPEIIIIDNGPEFISKALDE